MRIRAARASGRDRDGSENMCVLRGVLMHTLPLPFGGMVCLERVPCRVPRVLPKTLKTARELEEKLFSQSQHKLSEAPARGRARSHHSSHLQYARATAAALAPCCRYICHGFRPGSHRQHRRRLRREDAGAGSDPKGGGRAHALQVGGLPHGECTCVAQPAPTPGPRCVREGRWCGVWRVCVCFVKGAGVSVSAGSLDDVVYRVCFVLCRVRA